ncbi:MAG: M15 family peptidase, partial [Actinomycetota bacterium]|nr:M15 family peptidase [Actinomycetota bacterium]
NPVQNPWRDPRCTCWQPGLEFARSKDGPGVIREGSLPVRLFEERGWIWQNIDVADYMHFDTGYPSRPAQDAPAPVGRTS